MGIHVDYSTTDLINQKDQAFNQTLLADENSIVEASAQFASAAQRILDRADAYVFAAHAGPIADQTQEILSHAGNDERVAAILEPFTQKLCFH
jgi:hypothetical protein